MTALVAGAIGADHPGAIIVDPRSTPAIVAAGLRKSFGETVVLEGVDLTVAEGTVFALLGPNGAGKTTIVRILSTLVAADVETASNTPMILTLLPFLGTGFVPTDTMPAGLRQFATYQPFTPVTETVRGLLTGTHIGTNAIGASPGASASPSSPTCGPSTSTRTASHADRRAGRLGSPATAVARS
jgi:energy-coupling factor transporter ATP-binding protein EcfA2